jgi:hypothetical protein
LKYLNLRNLRGGSEDERPAAANAAPGAAQSADPGAQAAEGVSCAGANDGEPGDVAGIDAGLLKPSVPAASAGKSDAKADVHAQPGSTSETSAAPSTSAAGCAAAGPAALGAANTTQHTFAAQAAAGAETIPGSANVPSGSKGEGALVAQQCEAALHRRALVSQGGVRFGCSVYLSLLHCGLLRILYFVSVHT